MKNLQNVFFTQNSVREEMEDVETTLIHSRQMSKICLGKIL